MMSMRANEFSSRSTRHGMSELLRQSDSFLLVVTSKNKAPRLYLDVQDEEDMSAIITALMLDWEEACTYERAIFNMRALSKKRRKI